MLRQPCIWASRASLAQKWPGLRVVFFQKISRATFFVFWATQLVNIFWVICPQVPMKQIRRKSAVCYCIRPKPSDFIIISLRYGRAKLHWRRIQRCNLGGPAQWWRLWMVSRGPSIYYVSIWTGWVGSQNGHFCWRSVLCIYADVVSLWVQKTPKMCCRNIWMVPSMLSK